MVVPFSFPLALGVGSVAKICTRAPFKFFCASRWRSQTRHRTQRSQTLCVSCLLPGGFLAEFSLLEFKVNLINVTELKIQKKNQITSDKKKVK